MVADDDAPSRYFLGDAFTQLGARVALAAGGNEALRRACVELFDLMVLDRRMPDQGALEVLTALRQTPNALSVACPAVASSAELDGHEQQALLAAGFHAILLKPCTMQDLRDILAVAAGDYRSLPLLDDRQALSASGTPATVKVLRELFLQELLSLERELDALGTTIQALEPRLHKLRSSCGFCGALALSEHIVALQRHLRLAHRGVMLPLSPFRQSLRQTIQALETGCAAPPA